MHYDRTTRSSNAIRICVEITTGNRIEIKIGQFERSQKLGRVTTLLTSSRRAVTTALHVRKRSRRLPYPRGISGRSWRYRSARTSRHSASYCPKGDISVIQYPRVYRSLPLPRMEPLAPDTAPPLVPFPKPNLPTPDLLPVVALADAAAARSLASRSRSR